MSVGRLIPNSPAANCGQLFEGDQLLGVNYQDVSNIEHSDVVALIKNSGLTIRLIVMQPDKREQPPMDPPREVIGTCNCIMYTYRIIYILYTMYSLKTFTLIFFSIKDNGMMQSAVAVPMDKDGYQKMYQHDGRYISSTF